MTICAVDMYCLERDNCKNDQHCGLNGDQRHALVIDFQDIMTTEILFHLDLDLDKEIVSPCAVVRDDDEPDTLSARELYHRKSVTTSVRGRCHSRARREVEKCR
jgi:hypothetical protein